MIAIVDIIFAAGIGVAMATLFEGRWGPLLVAPPLLGLIHAVLLLIPRASLEADTAPAWLHVAAQLGDPWLIAAVIVASATGSIVAAMMLGQSRAGAEPSFWLPDMERPRSTSPRTVSLDGRVDRAVSGKTRRLVQEGYDSGEAQPIYEAPTMASRFAPAGAARARPAEPPAGANNRREPRRRTLLSGRLVAEGGLSVPCVIQNLSRTGAAVKLDGDLALPRLLSLIDVSNGVGHKAQVRWRFRERIGLRFLNSFDLSAPEGPEAESLARSWAALRT